jgi:hypothetical protein
MILPIIVSWVEELRGMSYDKPAHTMIFLNYNFILGVMIIKVYKNNLPFFSIAPDSVISDT